MPPPVPPPLAGEGKGGGAALPSRASVKRVPQSGDDRRQDLRRRLQLRAVVPIAVARTVVQPFGHLRVAGGARIAPVFVKRQAARIERFTDKVEHAADRVFLLV